MISALPALTAALPPGLAADLPAGLTGSLASGLAGAALGLSAGLSPGPLMALVIVQTLRFGPREGAKIAAAPLLTDLPIVALALALTAGVSGRPGLLGLLNLLGAAYLAWCALGSLRFKPQGEGAAPAQPRSYRTGALANLLNPSPYLFWGAVGAPMLARGWAQGWTAAAAFLAGFYGLLVGSKLLVAWLSGRVGPVMGSPGYRLVMRGLGLMLLGYAGWFALEGIRLLGL